jgi:Uma2 family endonuclease
VVTNRVVLTYRDYEALPADGRRYELHEGDLSVTPAPSPQHQEVSGRLYVLLAQHVEAERLGQVYYAPLDCILDDATVVQPDILFLDQSRVSLVSRRGIEGAPTLVVEILSPSTTLIDRSTKLRLYARYGVPYYWIVDSEARRIEVYRLAGGGYQIEATAAGAQTTSLPPFRDLAFAAHSLWR